jgi:hypothetical protein
MTIKEDGYEGLRAAAVNIKLMFTDAKLMEDNILLPHLYSAPPWVLLQ